MKLGCAPSILLGLTLLSLGAARDAKAEEKTEIVVPAKIKAQLEARQGEAAFDTQDWDQAIEHFKAAYKLYQDKEFLYAIAQSYRKKGDCIKAIEYYQRFAAKQPSPVQLQRVKEILIELRPQCDMEQKVMEQKEVVAKAPPQSARPPKDKEEAKTMPPGEQPSGTLEAGVQREPSTSLMPYVWTSLSLGVSSLVVGSVLIGIDEPLIQEGRAQPRYRPTKTPGIIAVSAGSAFVALAALLYLFDGVEAPKDHVALSCTADSLMVGYRTAW